jgi:hypothetical protein
VDDFYSIMCFCHVDNVLYINVYLTFGEINVDANVYFGMW